MKKLQDIGVDQIIDYASMDFYEVLKNDAPDYIFDVIGGKNLTKSIQLKPRKVVSVAFADTAKMHKTGVKLPGFLKFMMKLMMRKYVKLAKKNQVELIGQVTGPNGKLLTEVSTLAEDMNLSVPKQREILLSDIEKNGMSEKDLGKVIVF